MRIRPELAVGHHQPTKYYNNKSVRLLCCSALSTLLRIDSLEFTAIRIFVAKLDSSNLLCAVSMIRDVNNNGTDFAYT